jgi:HAMP domain-containing protein
MVVVALVFLAAAVWFVLEIRRNRAGRRAARVRAMQPGATVPAAPAAAVGVGLSHAPTEPASTGGVVAQLGALVDAIDRLVSRLGEVAVPVVGSSGPASAPAREAVDEPVPANPAPMFYAPAASRGAAEEHFDPYDWPTQEQLDQFAARRRATQSDM